MLHSEMPDFIPPDMWPPNSPYFNPVDYHIMATMQVQKPNIAVIKVAFLGGGEGAGHTVLSELLCCVVQHYCVVAWTHVSNFYVS